jgi:hypothetical protein
MADSDLDLTAAAQPPHTPWPFPNATTTPPASPAPKEQQAMPHASKPRAARAGGAQFKVACVLLAAGDEGLARDGIAEKLDASGHGVTAKALSNSLFNMKGAGRVERLPISERWRLTEIGRQWATGGANLKKQRAVATSAALTPVSTNVQLVPVHPSFRYWVDSNGSFAIEKNGQRIELELEETRHMLRYLDMVGEELIAAAASHAGHTPHRRRYE